MPIDIKNKTVIGRSAAVVFVDHDIVAPAKIDTGADGSTVWASDIFIDPEHRLHFKLFGETSSLYTGSDIVIRDYTVTQVKSSSGHVQIRYRVPLAVRIAGRRIKGTFTLTDRSGHKFPVLIGRRLLAGKYIVDVSQAEYLGATKEKTHTLNKELQKNPYEFYKKYHNSSSKDDKVER